MYRFFFLSVYPSDQVPNTTCPLLQTARAVFIYNVPLRLAASYRVSGYNHHSNFIIGKSRGRILDRLLTITFNVDLLVMSRLEGNSVLKIVAEYTSETLTLTQWRASRPPRERMSLTQSLELT